VGWDRAFVGLAIEEGEHAGGWIDRIRLDRSVLLAFVVVDLVDHIQKALRGVECDEGGIGASNLLNHR